MDVNHYHSIFTYLQSQQTAQQYLLECYKKIPNVDAERKSYDNCNVFLYCLQHGREYYLAGAKLDIVLQPVMFFYGMAHLLKACLLTKRPEYPESTSVLAHGVSARKRKKRDYCFLEDEVKVQYKGLFPYFAEHLYHIKNLPFEKITMKSLFRLIPELSVYFKLEKEKGMVKVGKLKDTTLHIPHSIYDDYHLTENAFLHRLVGFLPPIAETTNNSKQTHITLARPLEYVVGPFQVDMNGAIFLPSERDLFFPISEVMVHYLLLYNLSMLSRYEAEWWGELLATKPDIDYPFIAQFLSITQIKMPLAIEKFLYKNIEGQ